MVAKELNWFSIFISFVGVLSIFLPAIFANTALAQVEPSSAPVVAGEIQERLGRIDYNTIRFCYEPGLSPAEVTSFGETGSAEYKKRLTDKWLSEGSKRVASELVKTENFNQTLLRCIVSAEPSVGSDIKRIFSETRDESNPEDPDDPVSSGACEVGAGDSVEQDKALECIFERISEVVSLLSLLIGVALLGSTIFAGIQYITAGADSGKVQKAKGRLASNIIVLVLFLFSAAILNWILPGS